VAFGEFNFLPASVVVHPPTPTSESLWVWMQAVVRGIGLDPATGYHFRSIFLNAGLPEPEMNVCAPVGGRPGFPGYDYGAETPRSMLPLVLKLGIATADEVDIDALAQRLRAEIVGSGGVLKTHDLVGTQALNAIRLATPRHSRRAGVLNPGPSIRRSCPYYEALSLLLKRSIRLWRFL
jgi:hypothetical protein